MRSMSDAFSSAHRKLGWAKNRLADLERESSGLTNQGQHLCELFTEPHPNKADHLVYKMRLTKRLPDGIPELTGHSRSRADTLS